MKVITSYEYISKDFDCISNKLDSKFPSESPKYILDKWVQANPMRHKINCWILNQLELIKPNRILEIGGGISYFNRYINDNYDYVNVDFLAHKGMEEVEFLSKSNMRVVQSDWRNFDFSDFDVCIAIDIFPNADQGFSQFLRKVTKTPFILLSLTLYEYERFYRTVRVDGDEILTVVPWNLRQLQGETKSEILNIDSITKPKHSESAFENNRDVFLVSMRNE